MNRFALLAAALVPLAVAAQAPAGPAPLAFTHDDPALAWGPCPDFLPEGCAIAVLQGDPSQPGADVFFRVPGKSTIARHWHSSAEHMVLVSGELHVTYDGHDTVVLKTGSYAYGPAKLPHAGECVSDEPCVLAISFEEAIDAVAGGHDGH